MSPQDERPPPKERAPLARGALQSTLDVETAQQGKNNGGRPAAQGNRVERNRDQRPPRWDPPRGWTAAELLDKVWPWGRLP